MVSSAGEWVRRNVSGKPRPPTWLCCKLLCSGIHRADVPPHLLVTALTPAPPSLFPPRSKTFTTAETMLNARTVRAWLTERLGQGAVAKHMIAVRCV